MGSVYAIEEDTGRKILVRIECDHPDCKQWIKPGPVDGWTVYVVDDGNGTTKSRFYYCPLHEIESSPVRHSVNTPVVHPISGSLSDRVSESIRELKDG